MPTTNTLKRRRINPRWKKWDKSLRKTRALVRNLKSGEYGESAKWTEKMIAHYQRVIHQKSEVEPEKYME